MCWCDVNVIELSCPQIKARQYFHWSVNQFLSPVLSDGLLLKMFCSAFEEGWDDMYRRESDIFKRWIVRPSIHQFCCLLCIFFAAAPVGSMNKFFFQKTMRSYASWIFLDISRRFRSPHLCILHWQSLLRSGVVDSVALWRLFTALELAGWLSVTIYHISRFPQTSSEELI